MLAILSALGILGLLRALLKTNVGQDWQADNLGGGSFIGDTGTTATAPTATTFTCDGKSYTTNGLTGHVIVRAGVYGVILSNTGTVLTIDKWYDPASPGGAAAATPAAGQYVILPGGQPSWFMAVTENTTTPVVGDTTLTSELTTDGFARALATFAHTAGTNTFTLSKTFTATGTRTPGKVGFFNTANNGRMAFATLIPSPGALLASDTITITDTFTM